MRSGSSGVIYERKNSEATCKDSAVDKGGGDKGGGTNYLCVFLPPVAQDVKMPGEGLSGSSA